MRMAGGVGSRDERRGILVSSFYIHPRLHVELGLLGRKLEVA